MGLRPMHGQNWYSNLFNFAEELCQIVTARVGGLKFDMDQF